MLRSKQDLDKFVPLQRVEVTATIRSFAVDVNITQIFRNEEQTSIEAVYCFPIEEQAAVYAFTARIDDREIIAQLKEKETAQKEYSKALREGHGAYLLEQDEKSQDNFIINVGALPPGKECQIIISYVSELNLVENGTKIRFIVPTTIAPRYNPEKGGISSPAGTNSKYVQKVPYIIGFRCHIEKQGVSRISSISHPIQMDLNQQDVYVVTFAQQNTHLDRDILLDVELAENRSNTIVAVEPGAVMASFTPREEDCQRVIDNIGITNEFILVVDCSGDAALSQESSRELPILFKEITVVYNEKNAHQAEQLSKNMQADLGGTELLEPLQWLEKNSPSQGRARQIFLLTDGEISNVNQVLDLCRTMTSSTRIFAFGLGRSPSRSLVKGLARATNGRFVFIPPESSVDVHVGEQLQKALQPCITNVQVQWHLGTIIPTSVPTKTPPVYANDRLLVYALMDDKSTRFDHNSSVELKTEQHRLGEAKVTQIPSVANNAMIARLAAKAIILELQHAKLPSSEKKSTGSLQTRFKEQQQTTASANDDETMKETTKRRIIQLSLKYNILSPHTAFVGIEKRANASNEDMVLREVPIEISADDQLLKFDLQSHSFAPQMFCMSRAIPDRSTSLWKATACCLSNDDGFMDDFTQETCREIDMIGNTGASEKHKDKETWPSNDQDTVRYLINQQKFDGSWNLDPNTIEQLTGKSLSIFQPLTNDQILISAIVIVVLETRFASLSSMWHGIVQKARKHLVDLQKTHLVLQHIFLTLNKR